MAYETKTVTFSESEVWTLTDLAERLKELYGWNSYEISDSGSHIVFTAKDSDDDKIKQGYLCFTGFAYHLVDDFERTSAWEEYNVDWGEDLDICNYVWGDDEDGNPVMVHD